MSRQRAFNSRPHPLEAYEVIDPMDAASADRWVDLRGPEGVAAQLRLAFTSATPVQVPAARRGHWTHRFLFRGGLPESATVMLDLLTRYLTLPVSQPLDFALTFGWYKIAEDGVDPLKWKNSPVGDLVNRAKYGRIAWLRQRPFALLVDTTVTRISQHPVFATTPTVVSVPGHDADGKSFGERYAAQVAARTGKRLVAAEGVDGPRPPSKKSGSAHLEGRFRITSRPRGPVIVVDDVYRTGGTMRAAAFAARQAGASHVYGLAAVKTMRN